MQSFCFVGFVMVVISSVMNSRHKNPEDKIFGYGLVAGQAMTVLVALVMHITGLLK